MEKKVPLLKFVLVGGCSGKTSLLDRFVDDEFRTPGYTTIGVNYKIKTVQIDGTTVKLLGWDTAGQARFRSIVQPYTRASHGIMVVCDLSDTRDSETEYWLDDLSKHVDKNSPRIMVGTKKDLVSEKEINEHPAKQLADSLNIPFFVASAKTGENVEEAFMSLAKIMLEKCVKNDEIQQIEQIPKSKPSFWGSIFSKNPEIESNTKLEPQKEKIKVKHPPELYQKYGLFTSIPEKNQNTKIEQAKLSFRESLFGKKEKTLNKTEKEPNSIYQEVKPSIFSGIFTTKDKNNSNQNEILSQNINSNFVDFVEGSLSNNNLKLKENSVQKLEIENVCNMLRKFNNLKEKQTLNSNVIQNLNSKYYTKQEIEKLCENENLKIAHKTFIIKFEEIFLAYKTMATGLFTANMDTMGYVGSTISFLGQGFKLIPFGGEVLSTITDVAGSALKAIDKKRTINSAKQYSLILGNYQEFKKINYSLANKLISQFGSIWQLLKLKEETIEEKGNLGKLKEKSLNLKSSILKESKLNDIQVCSEYCVLLIITSIQQNCISENNLKEDLWNSIINPKKLNWFKKFKNSFTNIFDQNKVTLEDGNKVDIFDLFSSEMLHIQIEKNKLKKVELTQDCIETIQIETLQNNTTDDSTLSQILKKQEQMEKELIEYKRKVNKTEKELFEAKKQLSKINENQDSEDSSGSQILISKNSQNSEKNNSNLFQEEIVTNLSYQGSEINNLKENFELLKKEIKQNSKEFNIIPTNNTEDKFNSNVFISDLNFCVEKLRLITFKQDSEFEEKISYLKNLKEFSTEINILNAKLDLEIISDLFQENNQILETLTKHQTLVSNLSSTLNL